MKFIYFVKKLLFCLVFLITTSRATLDEVRFQEALRRSCIEFNNNLKTITDDNTAKLFANFLGWFFLAAYFNVLPQQIESLYCPSVKDEIYKQKPQYIELKRSLEELSRHEKDLPVDMFFVIACATLVCKKEIVIQS